MRFREIITIFILGVVFSSCEWNLNAPNGDGNGGSEPDTTAFFENASSNLPGDLSNTTTKARAADIEKDGDLDLILAIAFQSNKLLINDGMGSFSDESSSRLPSQTNNTQHVTVADLNNDGNPDLFFAGNQTNELYINNGRGSFSDLSNRIPVGGNTTSAEAQDIDGDGTTDLLLGNIGQNVILMNSGNAFFNDQTTQRLPQIVSPTQDVEFGDISGDNLRDIIVGNENTNRALINISSGLFSDQTTNFIPLINAVEETRDVNIIDVDGDGDHDIYFGNSGFQNGTNPQDRLLINNSGGLLQDQTANRLPPITTNTFDADFADLDQDGDLDLVVGNYNGGIRVLINNGSGFFTDQSRAWIPENFMPLTMDLEIADFNGDDLLDIYISVRDGQDQLLLQKEK